MSQRLKPRGTLIRFHPNLQIGVQVLIASDIRKSPEKGQTVLQARRARARWCREPVQHMGQQRVLRGDECLCSADVTAAFLGMDGRPRRQGKVWHERFSSLMAEAANN